MMAYLACRVVRVVTFVAKKKRGFLDFLAIANIYTLLEDSSRLGPQHIVACTVKISPHFCKMMGLFCSERYYLLLFLVLLDTLTTLVLMQQHAGDVGVCVLF